MDIIGSIVWPGEPAETTKVWRRHKDGALAYWTGAERLFDDVELDYEDDDIATLVDSGLVELHLDVLEQFHERMADTDRNLLAEIDELLVTVRAAM
jgi:hypothetical protein